ncbi:major royal jelly protein [Tepidicaulis marinus]|uniref:Major royal jelly protein n=1 Tax=Tepidicaulis marinus TaxID=1333998 RepID=A0A081B953_9HYPH|nr:L-dopachrome tautomerase-related protein [Tepidicaulis marinus]GAK44571.1 major royal jelly protein [Tepidicaulis marinus]
MRVWIKSGAAVAAFLGAVCAALYLRYGGGEPYPDLSTPPVLPEEALQVAAVFPEPFGNVAASADGRLFFTVHPESRPAGPRLYEWKDGEAVAYPNENISAEGFVTPLGLSVDQQGRLWVIDHGNHGLAGARLVAFDLASGQIVHDKRLGDTGEAGSFLNDLTVSPDGRYVYIADVSFFRQNPALVVYEVASGKAWRVLEGHPSVTAQDWIIENPVKRMTFFGGLVALKPGVDGIVIDEAGEYVYYAAMTHDGLYRVPAALLNAPETDAEALARAVERVGSKPLSDGLSIDRQGNVYITDVEHGGIARLSPQGRLETLIASDKVRWADGISYSGDGYFYFTDSAIPDQMLQSKAHIESHAPYYLYRFKADIAGIPGR